MVDLTVRIWMTGGDAGLWRLMYVVWVPFVLVNIPMPWLDNDHSYWSYPPLAVKVADWFSKRLVADGVIVTVFSEAERVSQPIDARNIIIAERLPISMPNLFIFICESYAPVGNLSISIFAPPETQRGPSASANVTLKTRGKAVYCVGSAKLGIVDRRMTRGGIS